MPSYYVTIPTANMWRPCLIFTMWNLCTCHDDVSKWKHFPRYWPFVRGIHRSPVNSPHKGQWRGALMFTLICAWMDGWVNNRKAGDLRRHCAHCDVTVMPWLFSYWNRVRISRGDDTGIRAERVSRQIHKLIWMRYFYMYSCYLNIESPATFARISKWGIVGDCAAN